MSSTAPRLAQRFRPRPRGGGPRPGPSLARAGGDPRAADGRSLVAPVLAATSAGRSQTLSAPSTSARRGSDLVVSEYSAEPTTAARSRRRSVARFLNQPTVGHQGGERLIWRAAHTYINRGRETPMRLTSRARRCSHFAPIRPRDRVKEDEEPRINVKRRTGRC